MSRHLRLISLIFTLLLAACTRDLSSSSQVTVIADGRSQVIVITDETTVSDVLLSARVEYDDDDRVNPPGHNRVVDGMTITVVDVLEETEIIEEQVAFERQRVPNDSLPPGETRLLQSGVNGIDQVTYRIVYEDGVEVSRIEARRVPINLPTDEVVMIGSQTELSTVTVDGKLVYISGGNVWLIEGNSANRRALTEDGGVDGRVFAFSADGTRLLFTRQEGNSEPAPDVVPSEEETPDAPEATGDGEPFNTLWLFYDLTDENAEALPVDLENVLYAEWLPGTTDSIIYSTGEPRLSFPGWQANNDLWRGQINPTGTIEPRQLLLEPSTGGIYGWYGTDFTFAPDGLGIAWAQPDSVGVLEPVIAVEPEEDDDDDNGDSDVTPTPTVAPDDIPAAWVGLPTAYERRTLLTFPPRTVYDFVWRPEVTWSALGDLLIATTHGPPLGGENPQDSPVYDLTSVPVAGDYSVNIGSEVGLWASPRFAPDGAPVGPVIAYMQADEPLDSATGRYRLMLIDRDGSNARVIYPPVDEPGIAARDVGFFWSPDGRQIVLVREGNLIVVDVVTGLAQQVTGDGFSSQPRWSP